jgi:RNA polymerase primary sigma factor
MVEVIAKMKSASVRIERETGRVPTLEEVAGDLGLDDDGVEMLRRAMRAARSGRAAASLEAMVGEGDGLEDPRSSAPDAELSVDHERARLQRLLDAIDPREAEVLKLRFGIEVEAPLTLREIGDRLGVSRERVRQIESRALRKLSEMMGDDEAESAP